MIRCTEKRRGRRIIKTKQWKSRRHRRCIERRSLYANSISSLYAKRLSQKSYQESVRNTSVALCAIGTSVTLRYLRPLRDSVCLLYKTFSLSLHISEEPQSFQKSTTNSGLLNSKKEIKQTSNLRYEHSSLQD